LPNRLSELETKREKVRSNEPLLLLFYHTRLNSGKYHAHVMEAGNEAAPINLPTAGCLLAETDDVGAALAKTGGESSLLVWWVTGTKLGFRSQ
jgi:hypothetical protein